MALKKWLGNLVGQSGLFHRDVSDDPVPSGVANPLPMVAAAGTALVGKVGIDQVTANANEVVVKGSLPSFAAIPAVKIDQTTPGTTNGVQVNAGSALIGKTDEYNKHELLVTRQMDYAGKTSGQTYNVPHVHKYRTNAAIFDAPSNAGFVEPATGSYTVIATQDGSPSSQTASTATLFAQHLFSFDLLTIARRTPGIPSNWTVADLRTNIKTFTVTWVGYGLGANAGAPANGALLKLWNKDTLAWVQHAAPTGGVLFASTVTLASTNRIDDTGFLHALAHSTYASDGVNPSTIYTDYIKVEMTLLGSVLNDGNHVYVEEQNIGQTTVTASASVAIATALDVSRCSDYAIAVVPSATHDYNVQVSPLGRDNVALVAAGDRTSLIAAGSKGLKMSAKTAVVSPKVTLYLFNADASDRTYYGRFIRLGVKGARVS